MELLGDVGHVESVLVRLEIVLVSVQDRFTVYIERSTTKKSFWTHPVELLDDVR
jgi:hypothetical protein